MRPVFFHGSREILFKLLLWKDNILKIRISQAIIIIINLLSIYIWDLSTMSPGLHFKSLAIAEHFALSKKKMGFLSSERLS